MKKPVIGITPLYDAERESLWMLPGYFEGIACAGGLPVMLPCTADRADLAVALELCDGVLFAGGQDVDPELYGAGKSPACGAICPQRDAMEQALLPMALDAGKPILGICRGLQIINALLGGTLYQDLPTEHPSPVCHSMPKPYDGTAHCVSIPDGTPLADLVGVGELPVNSRHHQAIRKLAPCLRGMAHSEDGLVEAFWHPGRSFLWAVQWHPEHSLRTSSASRKIFEAFLRAAEDARN